MVYCFYMKYLGIDFGEKKIGIAISNDDGQIAFPKTVLKNEGGLLGEIKKMCQEEQIGTIVLGRSLDQGNQKNYIQEKIEKFREAIISEIKLPVKWQDENFSSFHVMEEAKNKNNSDHTQAASLILQRYLERINN